MSVKIRQCDDLKTLMNWREEVLGEVFGERPSAELLEANRDYFSRHIKDGSHVALVADSDGQTAGCGAVCFQEELPSPDNPTGRCAYLMNIYVRPRFRKRGLATEIVRSLIAEARCRECGKIYLETTQAGEGLYKQLGFLPLDGYMKL